MKRIRVLVKRTGFDDDNDYLWLRRSGWWAMNERDAEQFTEEEAIMLSRMFSYEVEIVENIG